MKFQIIQEDYENSSYSHDDYDHNDIKIKIDTFNSFGELLESKEVKDFFGTDKGYDRISTCEATEFVRKLINDPCCQKVLMEEGFVNQTKQKTLEKEAKFTGRLYYQDWMGHLTPLTGNLKALNFDFDETGGKPPTILAEIDVEVIKQIDEPTYKKVKDVLKARQKHIEQREQKKKADAAKRKAREIAKAKKLLNLE
jgi:hypothetical protein